MKTDLARSIVCALCACVVIGPLFALAAAKVGVVDPCPMQGKTGAEQLYMQALRQAGHLPVLIPWTTNGTEIAAQLQRVQLVLFLGGEDVAPRRYGEAKSPRCETVNERRDAFEWAVLDECVRRRLPVFGICRGVQLVNCYFGGTLIQDIGTEVPNAGRHRFAAGEPRGYIDHEVEILDSTRLRTVLGRSRVSAKAWHHQSVERLAPGFRVSARTSDGVVEAIESDDYPAAGVQFHPEQNVASDPRSPLLSLFRRLPFLCGGGTQKERARCAATRTFMSYNVCECFGNYQVKGLGKGDRSPERYTNRLEAITHLIRAASPEWCALQEVCHDLTNGVDHVSRFAARTGMHVEFADSASTWPGLHFGGGWGVALLSKVPPLKVRRFVAGRSEKYPRTVLAAEFEDYVVYAAHFTFTDPYRMETIADVEAELAKETKPVFLVGDLNLQPTEKELFARLQEKFDILTDGTGNTWPAVDPTQRLDYILIDKAHAEAWRKLRAWSLPEKEASDHRPIFLEICNVLL